jgi:hypothetical protein
LYFLPPLRRAVVLHHVQLHRFAGQFLQFGAEPVGLRTATAGAGRGNSECGRRSCRTQATHLEDVSLGELSSLPADPRALVEYVHGKVPDGPGNMRWSQTFEALINLFDYYNMPSATAAEVIQAFQYIPGVKAVTDPGDVAFSLNEEKGFMIAKALFDPTTYRLMGISRTIGLDPAHPERPPMEKETTLQAPWIPVSGPFVRP